MKTKTVKMVQIVAASWEGSTGLTYSTLALGVDGVVYRFDTGCQGWYPMSMKVVTCKHKR